MTTKPEPPERIWVDMYDGPTYGMDNGSDWMPYVEGESPSADDHEVWIAYARVRTPASVAEAAERIADYLFENGADEHADRLALMDGKRNLGGWCKQSVVDTIASEFAPLSGRIEKLEAVRDAMLEKVREIRDEWTALYSEPSQIDGRPVMTVEHCNEINVANFILTALTTITNADGEKADS